MYYPKKTEADDLPRLDVNWLNRRGYFNSNVSGTIEWRTPLNQTGSLNVYSILSFGGDRYLRLTYEDINQPTGNQDYTVELTTTPCNYGGRRWWFVCPIATCGGRVGKLYKAGGLFACRHCYNLTYNSKNLNRHSDDYEAIRAIKAARAAAELEPKIKRRHYAGKATKKQVKYYKLYAQSSGRCFIMDDGTILL